MPTKSTQVMPNEILAILILPKSSPMKMDKARYKMVGPTPEPVKRLIIFVSVCFLTMTADCDIATFCLG